MKLILKTYKQQMCAILRLRLIPNANILCNSSDINIEKKKFPPHSVYFWIKAALRAISC